MILSLIRRNHSIISLFLDKFLDMMKYKQVYLAAIGVFALAPNLFAQGEGADGRVGSHGLIINVPEIALLDVYDLNTGSEAQDITLNVAQATSGNGALEAGAYDFSSATYSGLYLNYSSVVGNGSGTYDSSRSIYAQLLPGSNFPESLDLRITPSAPTVTANGGTPVSAGTVISQGILLGKTTPIGTDALLVNNIGSVYTGDQQNGIGLTYSLEQNGDFSASQAGYYTSTVVYTLTDL